MHGDFHGIYVRTLRSPLLPEPCVSWALLPRQQEASTLGPIDFGDGLIDRRWFCARLLPKKQTVRVVGYPPVRRRCFELRGSSADPSFGSACLLWEEVGVSFHVNAPHND